MDQARRRTVRVLPVRPDHASGCAACHKSKADRLGHRRCHGRQCLSLWALSADQGSHQRRCRSGLMTSPQTKSSAFALTRRKLVLGGSLVGGALIIGYTAANLGAVASGALSIGAEAPVSGPFGPFITIDRDNWVTVVN